MSLEHSPGPTIRHPLPGALPHTPGLTYWSSDLWAHVSTPIPLLTGTWTPYHISFLHFRSFATMGSHDVITLCHRCLPPAMASSRRVKTRLFCGSLDPHGGAPTHLRKEPTNGNWYQGGGQGWENPGGALIDSPACWGERPKGNIQSA